MNDVYVNAQDLLAQRDKRALPHLEQYAPVWIVNEKILLEEEAVQFNVVFLHPTASDTGSTQWVSRRYRYDGFNNTLYHKGQTRLSEDQALELTLNKEPYIAAMVTDTPNSYGG